MKKASKINGRSPLQAQEQVRIGENAMRLCEAQEKQIIVLQEQVREKDAQIERLRKELVEQE